MVASIEQYLNLDSSGFLLNDFVFMKKLINFLAEFKQDNLYIY